MLAPEQAQRGVVERLHAERDAVDAGRAKRAKRSASTEVGLASSVISRSGAGAKQALARSITAATVGGAISEGVPPPKKIERSTRGPISSAWRSISATSARPARVVDLAGATWLLKSQ